MCHRLKTEFVENLTRMSATHRKQFGCVDGSGVAAEIQKRPFVVSGVVPARACPSLPNSYPTTPKDRGSTWGGEGLTLPRVDRTSLSLALTQCEKGISQCEIILWLRHIIKYVPCTLM